MKISRRRIMRQGLLAAAAGALTSASSSWGGSALGLARAQRMGAPRKLVIVLADGGWDTTYSIDPKPDLETIAAPEGAIRRFGETSIWSHPSRPEVDRFFERWGERTAVVHGIQVRSFVHPDCIKRVLAGSPDPTAPDFGAIVADALGRDRPIPYLALSARARTGDLESIVGRVGATNQLLTLAVPGRAYPDALGAPALEPSRAEADILSRFSAQRLARERALRGATASAARQLEAFSDSLSRGDRLRAFIAGSELGTSDTLLVSDVGVQAAIALEALRTDLSQSVLIAMSGFDTHVDNTRQSVLQRGLFALLDALATGLAESGLGEETVIVCISEMGRTPLLNGQQGKDHWPFTSALVMGPGVRGGRSYGATDDRFAAEPVDLRTGEVGAAALQPASFAAGILELVGASPSERFPRVEPFRAFVA